MIKLGNISNIYGDDRPPTKQWVNGGHEGPNGESPYSGRWVKTSVLPSPGWSWFSEEQVKHDPDAPDNPDIVERTKELHRRRAALYGTIREVEVPPSADWRDDNDARKERPIATGVLDYFPDALAEVARVSKAGNDQHGTTGWDRSVSTDEANTLIRHFVDRGKIDKDGQRHSAKVAWRALAMLQKEIEAERDASK